MNINPSPRNVDDFRVEFEDSMCVNGFRPIQDCTYPVLVAMAFFAVSLLKFLVIEKAWNS